MGKLYINGHFFHQRLTGVQRYAIEVLKGFERAGYPFEVLKTPPLLSGGKLRQHVWEQFLLPHRKNKDDILWSPTNTGPAYAANHVITLHDIGVFPHPEWFAKKYVRWKRTLIPRMAHHARGILTVSRFSRKIICRHLHIDPKKVKVVYNGVDTDRFKPADKAHINRIYTKYDITPPYLLGLGSLDPRKNFSALTKAWKRCLEQEHLTDYRLVIAGGSHATLGKFKTEATANTVQFLGYVEDADLPALYSGAQGFLFPSLFEGFGLPVLEAMACGTPVVTSAGSALDEVAGDAALKVNPKNIDSIKKGIMELVESPSLRTSLIERGLERAGLFDWDQAAKSIYQYLMQEL